MARTPRTPGCLIELPVERPATTYAIKLFLPVLIVLISAGLMYLVRPDYVEGRIGIGVTALLTLVALQLTTNAQLPSVEYLMLIDKVYIASFAFIVAGIALVARTSWMPGRSSNAPSASIGTPSGSPSPRT